MALVYLHKKPCGEIFYIGIGKKESRVYDNNKRNKYWHNIVNKYGIDYEIAYNNLSYNDAKNFEKFLIKLYGRKDLNEGTLCNMTDGGDGSIRRFQTKSTKLKISKANKGRPSKKKGIKKKEYLKYPEFTMDVFST